MDASIRKYIAELIGTFVLVFFGVGAAIYAAPYSMIIGTALAFGLTVMVMSVTIGKISGCHLNPAISIAMFMDKKLDVKDLIGYVVCQIIGAIIAGALILSIYMGAGDLTFQEAMDSMGGANGLTGVNDVIWVGFIVELVLTFIFVLVVFGATSKNSGAINGGLYIGLALTMVHIVGIPLTGTSVNPARSIGLALFNTGALDNLWIFIVAPIVGGLLAWAVWKFVLCDPAEEGSCCACESAEEQ